MARQINAIRFEDLIKPKYDAQRNRATKIIELPALTVDLLKVNGLLIDNVFASLWRDIGMKTVLTRAGFNKRSGPSISDVIFGLMLWLWLQKDAIGMFARECLQGGAFPKYDNYPEEAEKSTKASYHFHLLAKTGIFPQRKEYDAGYNHTRFCRADKNQVFRNHG